MAEIKDIALKRAKLFLCLMIVLSVVYGGLRSVSRLYDMSAEKFAGTAQNAYDSIIANAENLCSVVKRYDKKGADEISEYIAIAKNNQNFSVRKKNLCRLTGRCRELYVYLSKQIDGEWDEPYLKEAYYNIKAYCTVLSADEYNETAKEYNKTVKQFPAFLFAAACKKAEMPVFTFDEFNLEV